jgi:hypothetical protein
MLNKYLPISFLCLLLMVLPVFTQSPKPTAVEESKKLNKEMEAKVLEILDATIKEIPMLRVSENRILMKAAAADLLWLYDETRARALISEALTGLNEVPLDDEEDIENPYRKNRSYSQLQSMLLHILAQRDPKLARRLLRNNKESSDQPVYSHRYDSSYSNLQLASRILESDPKQATEIVEESLEKRYPYQLESFLIQLRSKDSVAAGKLAEKILSKLRSDNLVDDEEAMTAAMSLLRISTNTSSSSSDSKSKESLPLLNQQNIQQLAEMIVSAGISIVNTRPGKVESIESVLDTLEKYIPSKASQLKRRISEINKKKEEYDRFLNGESNQEEEDPSDNVWSIASNGTAEQILQAAPKAPEEIQSMLYSTAINKLTEQGDLEQARTIINERVIDPSKRRALLNRIDQRALAKAIDNGEIEQAKQAISSIQSNEKRVAALISLAQTVLAKGNKEVTIELLNEARGLIGFQARTFQALGLQLYLASLYADVDPTQSLSIIEPSVDQINELINAAALIFSYMGKETREAMRDGEFTADPLYEIYRVGASKSQIQEAVRKIAITDVDRARSTIDRLQRNEVRLTARLLLIRSLLVDKSEKEPFKDVVVDY